MNTATTIDWTEELDRHRGWMLRVLRSRIGDWHAADDLIQDIALAVLRQEAKPSDPQKVAPWLYQLTVRQAINFHRRKGRKKNQLVTSERVESAPCDAPTPLEWMVAIEKQTEIQESLQKLRPKDREILILKYAQQWTYEQIAQHTGAKIKTIEYRLMRARQLLRRQILNRLPAGELEVLTTTSVKNQF
ncbi:MAG: RNA polymerase sigma factor [Pirellulaceae bacterium]